MSHPLQRRLVSFRGLCAATLSLLLFVPTFGRAADAKLPSTALDKVPADAEAYGSTLRLGETIASIARSKAWEMIWDDSSVQELWKKAKKQYDDADDDWAPIKKFLKDPDNKDLPALALDALSQEIFVYAGSGWGDLFSLFQELGGGIRYGPALQKLLDGGNDDNADRIRVRIALQTLAEKPDRVRIPDLVVGFKVSEPVKVAAQLKRLDPLLADALKDTPFKGRSERIKVGGDEFLVLKLDGSMIPWDDLLPKLAMYEDKPNEFAPLIDHLKKMKFNVAVGVRQGYLLLAFGDSIQRLEKFGGPGPKLASLPEFKPLQKFADKPITSIGYTSANLLRAVSTKAEDFAGMAELGKTALKAAELPADLQKAVEKDIDGFLQDFVRGIKKAGAQTSFSFRTPRGFESYDYDFTTPESKSQQPADDPESPGQESIDGSRLALRNDGRGLPAIRQMVQYLRQTCRNNLEGEDAR